MPQKLLSITYSGIFSGATRRPATSFPGTPPHSTEKILYNWKWVKCKQVSVVDGTGRYSPLISVFANLSQLSTKDLPVSMIKKKTALKAVWIASLQESWRALVVSWSESTRCMYCWSLQANSVQSSVTSLAPRKQLPSKRVDGKKLVCHLPLHWSIIY